jgi:hypothetical protein
MRNKFSDSFTGAGGVKRGNATGMAGAMRGAMLTVNPPVRHTHFDKMNTTQSVDKTAHSSVLGSTDVH